MELESEFIVEPELDGGLAGPELLHRSEKGFAEIWRVMKFSQFVVLKALKPEYRENPVYEALLKKEFEIGYSLNHPSVCRTWHFRRHPQLGNCIEMEWVDGVTLSERFRSDKPDDDLFLKIADELCDAVSYLHSRQVIHRDIKPSNILVTHNGDNVKLIDFGLADSDDSAVLKMAAGTENHIAPEVLEGRQADVRTDIWGVGHVLSGLTDSHSKAIRKATARRPEDRYPNIAAFRKDLMKRPARPWIYVAAAIVAAILTIGAALWGARTEKPDSKDIPQTQSTVLSSTDSGSDGQGTNLDDDAGDATSSKDARPADSSKPARPAEASKSKDGTYGEDASREDIDELFRKATDLFE